MTATVTEHYASHLAPIYVWMAGGFEAALTAGAQDLASLSPGAGLAIDLGAGFGMHSIPLARLGYRVVAIDTSDLLLSELDRHRANLPIRTVSSDLQTFREIVTERAALILCMGDTLTHLSDFDEIERLCDDLRHALEPGGKFLATFRDYSSPASGDKRFIPVRSDADRILTCLVEHAGEHVLVHDLLHERRDMTWGFSVSSYRKLRLPPAKLEQLLTHRGFSVRLDAGPRGMVRVEATL